MHYPYLREKVGAGSGIRNAFLNWAIIFGFLYLLNPFIRAMLPDFGSEIVMPDMVSSGPVVDAGSTLQPIGPIGIVVTVQVSYPTPSPEAFTATLTPTPDRTGYPQYTVGYSYYYPDLGGVNCHADNWNGSHCADTTASGLSWRDNLGRAVAIPPSWVCYGLGYGSIVEVLSPDTIKAEYLVVDLCAGCESENWDDGQWRLDFLDDRQRLQWAYPVVIRFAFVVPPTEEVKTAICGG